MQKDKPRIGVSNHKQGYQDAMNRYIGKFKGQRRSAAPTSGVVSLEHGRQPGGCSMAWIAAARASQELPLATANTCT